MSYDIVVDLNEYVKRIHNHPESVATTKNQASMVKNSVIIREGNPDN